MKYVRMPIERESPEKFGYGRIRSNLSESSIRDLSLSQLGIDLSDLTLFYGSHRGDERLRALIAQASGVSPDEVLVTAGAAGALFIVTTTPATAPLMLSEHIRPGTHISAFGSDTPHKQELDSGVLARASRIVVDSLAQCRLRGEVHQALKAGVIIQERIEEIGDLILGRRPGRTDDDEITVFDSTGLAVQDVQIATAVTHAAVTA